MKKFFKRITLKKLMPFFIFAMTLIVFQKFINNFESFGNFLGEFTLLIKPFINAFLLAYLINLLCNHINKLIDLCPSQWIKRHSRGLSILTAYLIIILITHFILIGLIPYILNTIRNFNANLGGYISNVKNLITEINTSGALPFYIDLNKIINLDKLSALPEIINLNNLSGSFQKIMQVPTFVMNAFLTFVLSIYYLIESKSIISFFKYLLHVLMPDKYSAIVIKYLKETNNYFKLYIGCLVFDSLVLVVLASISMFILGLDYWLMIGIFVGSFNVIPYFGAIIAVATSSVFVVFTSGFQTAFLVFLTLLVIQQIDGNIIQPKIMGDSLNLSPILIIFSITVGGYYFGIIGMIISVPIITILKKILLDLLSYIEAKKIEAKKIKT